MHRHGYKGRKFNRERDQRSALLKSLSEALIKHESIETTLPKAKELRPFAEKAVTLGRRVSKSRKNGDAGDALNATRQIAGYFFAGNANRDWSKPHLQKEERTAGVAALKKITGDLADRFADRPGGYLRIIKLGRRTGDGAEMAIIEFVGNEEQKTKVKKDARWIS